MSGSNPNLIANLDALRAIYDAAPVAASIVKETDHLHPAYRPFVEAAPFCVLATNGPNGPDASPRGDGPGFIAIEDDKTLLLPDRRGNNRIDSLRNILHDPRVALLFLIPGINETLRVNGTAAISVAPDLLARFAHQGKAPKSVLIVSISTVFFQCARALLRSELWNPDKRLPRSALPSTGAMLAALSAGEVGGESYDQGLNERQAATLY